MRVETRERRRRRQHLARWNERGTKALVAVWLGSFGLSVVAHNEAIVNPGPGRRASAASLFGHLQGQEYVASEAWLLTARLANVAFTVLPLLVIAVFAFRQHRRRRGTTT